MGILPMVCSVFPFGYAAATCSREEIRTYLESLAPHVQRGGFIPFCDHRCPPNVDPDDYLYYLDTKRDLFGM